MSDFGLIYAYALALFAALLLWVLRSLASALSATLQDWARAHRELKELEARHSDPDFGSTTRGSAMGLGAR